MEENKTLFDALCLEFPNHKEEIKESILRGTVIEDFLVDCETLKDYEYETHRRYQTYTRVVSVGNKIFGFEEYTIIGDYSMSDMDARYDDNTITEYKSVEVTITDYLPITNK